MSVAARHVGVVSGGSLPPSGDGRRLFQGLSPRLCAGGGDEIGPDVLGRLAVCGGERPDLVLAPQPALIGIMGVGRILEPDAFVVAHPCSPS